MPSHQWLRPVALALLVVLAGCAMPSGSQPSETKPTASATPTPSPTASVTATPSSTPPSEQQPTLPPGVTMSGVENASALLDAHRESLRAAGFRIDETRADAQFSYAAAANYSAYRVIPGQTTDAPAVWANESLTLAREQRDNETVYQRPPRLWPGPARLTAAESLRTLFGAAEYAVDGTEPCGERTCVALTATGSARFENFSARALVDASGVVHRFHATYGAGENGTRMTEYRLVLSQRGNVTVSRPPWADAAIENTA